MQIICVGYFSPVQSLSLLLAISKTFIATIIRKAPSSQILEDVLRRLAKLKKVGKTEEIRVQRRPPLGEKWLVALSHLGLQGERIRTAFDQIMWSYKSTPHSARVSHLWVSFSRGSASRCWCGQRRGSTEGRNRNAAVCNHSDFFFHYFF